VGRLPGATTTTPLARPLCPYPQTAEYKGSGNVFDAASWQCGGNLEATQTVCPDVLVRYKHEVLGNLDYEGSGVLPAGCVSQGGGRANGH